MDKGNKPSSLKRIFAYLLDMTIITIPLIVFIIIGILFKPSYWLGINQDSIIISLIITQFFLYTYILFKDSLFDGRSIGKKVFNIQVIDKDEQSCSITKSFLRNIILIIPFLPLIELIIIIFDKTGKRFGDKLAKTQVKLYSSNQETKKRKNYSILFISTIFSLLCLAYIILGFVSSSSYYENYVYLTPSQQLTDEQLSDFESMVKTRLNSYDYPILDLFIKNNQLILKLNNELKENRSLLKKIIQSSNFEAKIGDTIVFRDGKDIEYVCRSAECSGIDSSVGCVKLDSGEFTCQYKFVIRLSEEAAKRQAKTTNNLSIIETNGQKYLDKNLQYFVDGELINELKISSEIKGKEIRDIQISGTGIGETKDSAITNSIENMKKLQTILISESIPYQFEISKVN